MSKSTRKPGHLRLLLLLLAVGAAGALGYNHYYLSRDIGEGPAGPAVAREPFEHVWTERPVLLLGIGDSVTRGFGASPGFSYFERLVKNPPSEFNDMEGICLERVLPNFTSQNLAENGTTSQEHERLQLPQIETQSEETLGLVVMTTGGNDLIHMYGRIPPREGAMYGATKEEAAPWTANFESRLGGMLDDIAAHFPGGCHIFLANIYDPSDATGNLTLAGLPAWPDGLELLGEYNAIIARCAEAREFVHLVDIHQAFLGHGIYSAQFWRKHYDAEDPHYWYYTNLEDPNDRGYDAIRRLMLNAMAEVLANGTPR